MVKSKLILYDCFTVLIHCIYCEASIQARHFCVLTTEYSRAKNSLSKYISTLHLPRLLSKAELMLLLVVCRWSHCVWEAKLLYCNTFLAASGIF